MITREASGTQPSTAGHSHAFFSRQTKAADDRYHESAGEDRFNFSLIFFVIFDH
jgi:hypothetical protein